MVVATTLTEPILGPTSGGGSITNGSQLTAAMTSPTAILATGTSGYPGNLTVASLPGRGFWRGDTSSEFIPVGSYVYNNSISNLGGTLASDTVIDGYIVPAGTKVAQFRDFSAGDFFMSDSTSFLFRGCRQRGAINAPGYFNCAAGASAAKFYFFYGDYGGLGSAPANFNEIPIKIANGASVLCYRLRIQFTTTGIQPNIAGPIEVTECFISDLTDFGNGISHLNGTTMNGGEIQCLMLRNNIAIQSPDASGRAVNQTDCQSMFQDFGTFTGIGINRDGSTGYKFDNNYYGGTGYCIYAGKNAGSASNSVNNVVVTNTLITTQWYSGGGFNGPISAEPVWGTLGNSTNNNRYADGVSAGTLAWANG